MEIYRTIGHHGTAEYVVEKSRFIVDVLPIIDEVEAKNFIESIRKKYWDATHHVWAYIIGTGQSVQRFSDDGEPSGTAGMPALSVLKKEEVTDLCVVITRYFGGIKLGAGGLVRAYTKAATLGLLDGGIVERSIHVKAKFCIPYSLLGSVQRELEGTSVAVGDIVYAQDVMLILWIPEGDWMHYQAWAVNISNGQSQLVEEERSFFSKDCDM